ncbi:predicted protein [Chaetomium globosum CBS 148.51]|uniref:Transcription factor domain-containing protein n=1 Tax=Chaetomium globosum (strain ATCC 6205 / CBS 148.51 / DSM 1962 / NBRC 6347 / NRRL 1970) TaxID=306901 RepID=Q2GND2_CHAGB|nr:uncharacterized protein CHGG_10522 [Chaetomium globosum CBS 148.51]EAQ84118.1 predicted protein [Chaetomium globosum CBS 148.51]
MKFEFVDNSSTIDKTARKRIRSHVAIGRNAGKKISRRSKKELLRKPARAPIPQTASAHEQPESSKICGSVSILGFPRPSALPAHLQQGDRFGALDLVQRAISFLDGVRHAPELDLALDYSSESKMWSLQPLFQDEAYFHGAMAVFFAACPSLPGLSYPSPVTNHGNWKARMRHLGLALRLVNTRLSGKDAASTETVTTVLILGLYERQQGEFHRGLVHMDGMQRILQMRGGILEFSKNNPDIARKILRCVPV